MPPPLSLHTILLTSALATAGLGCDRERCEDPDPMIGGDGQPTGYVRCADGSVNRVDALPIDVEHFLGQVPACTADEDPACVSERDCTDAPDGACAQFSNEFGPWCACAYLCSTDADCEDGQVCLHPKVYGYEWPSCVDATCTTNADCPSGECGVWMQESCDLVRAGLACRGEEDDCRTMYDCRVPDSHGNHCVFGIEHFVCDTWHACD